MGASFELRAVYGEIGCAYGYRLGHEIEDGVSGISVLNIWI